MEESATPVIILTNQILSNEEAAVSSSLPSSSSNCHYKTYIKVMRANSWLYHYYMVQSRLQYGLAYGAHSPAALSSLYYPHVQVTNMSSWRLIALKMFSETNSSIDFFHYLFHACSGFSLGGSQPLPSSTSLRRSHLPNAQVIHPYMSILYPGSIIVLS